MLLFSPDRLLALWPGQRIESEAPRSTQSEKDHQAMAADKLHDSGIVLMMSGIGTYRTSRAALTMSVDVAQIRHPSAAKDQALETAAHVRG